MSALVKPSVYVAWLTLIVLTAISWTLGTNHGLPATAHHLVGVIIFAVAVFKARLVGLYFMELKSAPRTLRAVFEIYCFALFVLLSVLYSWA